MRTPFDQFGKQMVRSAVEGCGSIETDAEVPAEARRIDLWFTPDETRASVPDYLAWLGRMIGSTSTLEFFHKSPSGEELVICLIKHGEFRHFLSRRKEPPPLPMLWVISSGRPDGGIDGLGFRPIASWPSGIYEGPLLLWTRLVVVNELPVARSTLLLRLLGAGSVLRQAIAELQVLPADAPERVLALPILVGLRLAVPSDPATQTNEEQEFLMTTQDIVEIWRQEAVQEGFEQGVEQGLERGERKVLLRQLRRRFGAEVDGEIERRIATAPVEQVELWTERVLSAATLAELLAD